MTVFDLTTWLAVGLIGSWSISAGAFGFATVRPIKKRMCYLPKKNIR